RLPIQYAMLYPERLEAPVRRLELRDLSFLPIDPARYPCYTIVLEAASQGPAAMIAVNAADEIAVERYLHGDLAFTAIAGVLERALGIASRSPLGAAPDLASILAFDREVRRELTAKAMVRWTAEPYCCSCCCSRCWSSCTSLGTSSPPGSWACASSSSASASLRDSSASGARRRTRSSTAS